MKLRTKIFIAVCILFYIYCGMFTASVTTLERQPFCYITGVKCGIVEDNFTELRTIKYGTSTDYFLKIDYNGHTEIEKVSAETFYNHYKKGTKICFDITEGSLRLLYFWVLSIIFLSIIGVTLTFWLLGIF